jgi:hypothetical protein
MKSMILLGKKTNSSSSGSVTRRVRPDIYRLSFGVDRSGRTSIENPIGKAESKPERRVKNLKLKSFMITSPHFSSGAVRR